VDGAVRALSLRRSAARPVAVDLEKWPELVVDRNRATVGQGAVHGAAKSARAKIAFFPRHRP